MYRPLFDDGRNSVNAQKEAHTWYTSRFPCHTMTSRCSSSSNEREMSSYISSQERNSKLTPNHYKSRRLTRGALIFLFAFISLSGGLTAYLFYQVLIGGGQ